MSATESPTAPPGWYPDPDGQRQWRAWNGRAWTELTRPFGEPRRAAPSLDTIGALGQLCTVGVVAFFAGLGLLVSALAHWPGTAHPAPRWYAVTATDLAIALVLFATILYARAAVSLGGHRALAVVPGVNVLYVGALVAARVYGRHAAPRRLIGDVLLLVIFAVRANAEPWLAVAPALVAFEHAVSLRTLIGRLVGPPGRAPSIAAELEATMAYEEWGPLGGLVGTWESGWDGLDVSYHNEDGKIEETVYREKVDFKPFGPVDNGEQHLYGLDYRMAAYRQGEDNPFHTEIGYWMWDAGAKQVMRCFMVPRASTLIAGATVEPDATTFRLEAVLGSNTYGILSNKYLDQVAKTTRFDVTITVTEDTFSYDETTVVEHQKWPTVIMHTDRNTLKLVSRGG